MRVQPRALEPARAAARVLEAGLGVIVRRRQSIDVEVGGAGQRLGIVGIERERARERGLRLVEPAQLLQRGGAIVVRLDGARLDARGLLGAGERAGEVAVVVAIGGAIEQRVERPRRIARRVLGEAALERPRARPASRAWLRARASPSAARRRSAAASAGASLRLQRRSNAEQRTRCSEHSASAPHRLPQYSPLLGVRPGAPMPRSTLSGTSSCHDALHHAAAAARRPLRALPSGASSTSSSCTVSSMRDVGRLGVEPRCTAIIASLSRSAAVPWIGVLRAMRSPYDAQRCGSATAARAAGGSARAACARRRRDTRRR